MFKRNSVLIAVIIGIDILASPLVRGQSDASVPKWEAVSIKPCDPNTGRPIVVDGRGPTAAPQGPGRMTLTCVPVEVLIHQSYLLFPDGKLDLAGAVIKVENGPAWMYSDRYTIEAKAEAIPGQTPPGQGTMQGPMLRALLADRFKLQVHRGTTPVPVYALSPGKDGPRLQTTLEGSCFVLDSNHPPPLPAAGQPSLPACGIPHMRNGVLDFHGATMAQVCAALSNRTDRRVIDKTGLKGTFDILLNWSGGNYTPGEPPPPPPPPPQPGDPPIVGPDRGEVTAQIQNALQKFGLRLEPTQAPGDNLVVDHVERPSEN